MDYASTHTAMGEDAQTCENCGAEYLISVPKQSGHNEREEYYCPECNKKYYVRASLPINNIRLIKSRTDGKSDKYSNSNL